MTTYTITESEHEELMNMAKVKNRVGILRLLSALEPNTQEPAGHFVHSNSRWIQVDADCWPNGSPVSQPLYAAPQQPSD